MPALTLVDPRIFVILLVVAALLLGGGVLITNAPAVAVAMPEPIATPAVVAAPITWRVEQFSDDQLHILRANALAEQARVGEIDLDLTNSHAWAKHGPETVGTVRAAMLAQAQVDPSFFKIDPCLDGRIRIVLELATTGTKRLWAIWVLDPTDTAGVLREVTAYTSQNENNVRKILENCGNGTGMPPGLAAA